MITSGTHLLFGELCFASDAQAQIERWLAAQSPSDRYAARDQRWWAEAVFSAQGTQLRIFDEDRSSYTRVEQIARAIDGLVADAVSGTITLQHTENGFHVRRWKLTEGRPLQTSVETLARSVAAPAPDDPRRRHLRERLAAQDVLWERRTPSERFDEVLVRNVPHLRGILLVGGTEAHRSAAIRAIATVWSGLQPWDGVGDPPAGAVRVTQPLSALSSEAQGALRDALAETETRVLLFADGDPGEAVRNGSLRQDLYHRIRAGQLDLSAVHP